MSTANTFSSLSGMFKDAYGDEDKMPVKSKAQARLMSAVANNKKFAKKVGIKQSVGKEFIESTPKGKFKKLKERLGKEK